MSFTESVNTVFSKYADFTGRAARSEYWWFVLFTVLATLVLAMFSGVLAAGFCLLTVIPSITVATRRLHDSGRSGWMQLIYLLPFIGGLILLYFLVQPSDGPNRFGELD